jgi:hypothetical protein
VIWITSVPLASLAYLLVAFVRCPNAAPVECGEPSKAGPKERLGAMARSLFCPAPPINVWGDLLGLRLEVLSGCTYPSTLKMESGARIRTDLMKNRGGGDEVEEHDGEGAKSSTTTSRGEEGICPIPNLVSTLHGTMPSRGEEEVPLGDPRH